MSNATSFLLAARLARREVRRRPWRTLLVALLVAVPVAGMTVAAGFVRTDHQTPAQQWRLNWGRADVVLPLSSSALPAGSRTTSWRSTWTPMRTVDRKRAHVEVMDMPLRDPVVGGVVQLMEGRPPAAPDEAFLSRRLAREFGVGVGDTLSIERPTPHALRVVGVGERRAWWGGWTIVLAPGTPFPGAGTARGHSEAAVTVAVDLPDSITQEDLLTLGFDAESSMAAPWLVPQYHTESGNEAVAWSWVIGAVVLTVVGIVIASAFAAGARRQLATLGQLAANGAQPAVLRRVLFLQGTWAGVIGTVLGLALGGGALVALAPHADRMLSRDADPWRLQLVDFLPIVVLGVAAATVAALVPARSTSRVPVLTALAGRRPLGRVPGWVTGAGLIASACGLGLLGLAVLGSQGANGSDSQVWVLTAILGGMAVLLGACAITPAYTSVLEEVGTRLGGAWRFAARSLARQRTRSSAVVSAVCASGALAVLAAALVLSFEASTRSTVDGIAKTDVYLRAVQTPVYTAPEHNGAVAAAPPMRPPVPLEAPTALVEAVHAALPGADVIRLTAAGQSIAVDGSYGFPYDEVVIVDDAARRVYRLPRDAERTLADRGAIRLVHPDETLEGPFGPGDARTTLVPAHWMGLGALPRVLVTPEWAQASGLAPAPGPVVVRAPEPLTEAQQEAVADTVEDYRFDLSSQPAQGEYTTDINADWPYDDDFVNPLLLEAILAGAALVFTLFVVATGLALAAAETRDERDVLTVVGASPATMQSTSGRKAALLAVLGGVLAVPVGFLPVVVFAAAEDSNLPLVFPWRVVLLLVVAVPIVAAAVTTLGSAVAVRVRPVRISTMAFD